MVSKKIHGGGTTEQHRLVLEIKDDQLIPVYEKTNDFNTGWLYATSHPFPKYTMQKYEYTTSRIHSVNAYIEPPPTQWNPFTIPMNVMAPLAGVSVHSVATSEQIISNTHNDFLFVSKKMRTSMQAFGASVSSELEDRIRTVLERKERKSVSKTTQIGFTASNVPMVQGDTISYHQTTFRLIDEYGEFCGSFDYFEPDTEAFIGDYTRSAAEMGVKLDFTPGNLMSHSARLPPPNVENMLGPQHRRQCMMGSEYHMFLEMRTFIENGATATSSRTVSMGANAEVQGSMFGFGASLGFDVQRESGAETTQMFESSATSAWSIDIQFGKIESGAFDYTLIPSLYSHNGVLTLKWNVEVSKYGAWGGVFGLKADPIFRTPFSRPGLLATGFPLQFYSQDIVATKTLEADHYDVNVTLQNAAFCSTRSIRVQLIVREVNPFMFHIPPWEETTIQNVYGVTVSAPQSIDGDMTFDYIEPMEEFTVTFNDIHIPAPLRGRKAQIISYIAPPEDDDEEYAFPEVNKWAYTSIPSLLDDLMVILS